MLYLIPARCLLGHLPLSGALKTFSPRLYAFYHPFVQSIRSGDPGLYHRLVNENEPVLLKLGIFLAMERIKTLAIRCLFRKVWLIMGKPTRLAFRDFETACSLDPWEDVLDLMDTDTSANKENVIHRQVVPEAVECLLANQIAQGWIRGYLSREKQMVVLSKVDPFPSLSKLNVSLFSQS